MQDGLQRWTSSQVIIQRIDYILNQNEESLAPDLHCICPFKNTLMSFTQLQLVCVGFEETKSLTDWGQRCDYTTPRNQQCTKALREIARINQLPWQKKNLIGRKRCKIAQNFKGRKQAPEIREEEHALQHDCGLDGRCAPSSFLSFFLRSLDLALSSPIPCIHN